MSAEGKSQPSAPSPQPSPQAPSLISIEEFQRLALRLGVVTAAQDHPNADRLLVLMVDLGEGVRRQVVAGIKGSYQAEQLVGKTVVVVANMKPATLRGIESQGMILAASDGAALTLVIPEQPLPPGSLVK